MKKLLSSLALVVGLALGSSAQAQEDQTYTWYFTGASSIGLSMMDVNTAKREGNLVAVQSVLYLFERDAKRDYDFTVTLEVYDCSVPGKSRFAQMYDYKAYVKEPIDGGALSGEIAAWRQAPANSIFMRSWKTACNGPEPDAAIKASTHEDVLARVRAQYEENGRR